jgi:SulP family sulfate permease
VVLVDGESINGIDATAIDAINELYDELKRSSISLRFARVRAHVMDVMRRSGLNATIGDDYFYLSIQAGVDAFLEEQGTLTENS